MARFLVAIAHRIKTIAPPRFVVEPVPIELVSLIITVSHAWRAPLPVRKDVDAFYAQRLVMETNLTDIPRRTPAKRSNLRDHVKVHDRRHARGYPLAHASFGH